MSLPLFIGISFSRLYPISFTAHLTLERFLIKTEWTEKHRNCCQGRISFWSWEDFSLVEFSPLPEDVSRQLCSQTSCEEKLTRCKQSYQARKNRRPPCLTSKSIEWPCWTSPAEKSFKHHENSPSNKHHSLVCTAREGSNVQEGISGESTHCCTTTPKMQPLPPHFCAIPFLLWKYFMMPTHPWARGSETSSLPCREAL